MENYGKWDQVSPIRRDRQKSKEWALSAYKLGSSCSKPSDESDLSDMSDLSDFFLTGSSNNFQFPIFNFQFK